MNLIGLTKNKIAILILSILSLLTAIYTSNYVYVNLYHPPLLLPDDKVLVANSFAVEAKSYLVKRWNTDSSNISVLLLLENGQGTTINFLDTNTFSGAIMFLPIGDPSFKIQLHPLYKEIVAKAIGSVYTEKGMLYLTDEYIPQSPKEKQIVRNYYAGKYTWLDPPNYRVIVRANLKYGRFQVGSTHYPIYFGIPIDLFPIRTT